MPTNPTQPPNVQRKTATSSTASISEKTSTTMMTAGKERDAKMAACRERIADAEAHVGVLRRALAEQENLIALSKHAMFMLSAEHDVQKTIGNAPARRFFKHKQNPYGGGHSLHLIDDAGVDMKRTSRLKSEVHKEIRQEREVKARKLFKDANATNPYEEQRKINIEVNKKYMKALGLEELKSWLMEVD